MIYHLQILDAVTYCKFKYSDFYLFIIYNYLIVRLLLNQYLFKFSISYDIILNHFDINLIFKANIFLLIVRIICIR